MSIGIVLLFILGLGMVPLGADLFVRGAARLAATVGVSPLVIGLTVVAYGTSAPELAVSVYSGWAGSADIALGNVIGSNVCNVLLILGSSAIVAPLAVSRQLVRFEVPVMIAVAVLLLLIGLDGRIGRLDGLLLFAGCLAYTTWSIRQSRRQVRRDASAAVVVPAVRPTDDPPGAGDGPAPKTARTRWPAQVGLILAGLGVLLLGSHWVVEGAVVIATRLGMSELVIGLTIIAIGTSLPELATSVAASRRGERDIAIGNVVGSNIFNILLVLGLASAVCAGGIAVPDAALRFDMPIMIAVSLSCLPIFFTGGVISRWEGAFFLLYYAAYTGFLMLLARHGGITTATDVVAMLFVVPMCVLTLLVIVWSLHRRSTRRLGRRNPGPR